MIAVLLVIIAALTAALIAAGARLHKAINQPATGRHTHHRHARSTP